MTVHIRVAASDISFGCEPGETILDAAERAGFALPYSCRKGVCASCEGGVLTGTVALGRSASASGPAERIKFCIARPQTSVDIAPTAMVRDAPPTRKCFDAAVHRIDQTGADVAILHLRLPIGRRAPFRAGQYVRLTLPDGSTRNYSLANPPHDNSMVELHVRRVPDGLFSHHGLATMAVGDQLRIEVPYGRFSLDEGSAPILMLATGTGFAPLQAMVKDLARRQIARSVHLFWGAATAHDLYRADLARGWAERLPWFRFTPVLSRPSADWAGAVGYVQDVAFAAYPDPASHEIYACGNPEMVEAARRLFTRQGGLPSSAFHADAFVPSGEQQPTTAPYG